LDPIKSYQSTKQSLNPIIRTNRSKPINKSINQSIKQASKASVSQSTDQLLYQSLNPSVGLLHARPQISWA